jgi:hypothetical protein
MDLLALPCLQCRTNGQNLQGKSNNFVVLLFLLVQMVLELLQRNEQ